MEQLYKRCTILILGLLMSALCSSCSNYNTYFGTWYCEELGIIFSFEDQRSFDYVAFGSMMTNDGKEGVYCIINPGGSTDIFPVSEYGKKYMKGQEDTCILSAIAKYRNGKLLMYEWNGEYTGKIYVFEQIAPGPTLVTKEELPTAQ